MGWTAFRVSSKAWISILLVSFISLYPPWCHPIGCYSRYKMSRSKGGAEWESESVKLHADLQLLVTFLGHF